MLSAFQFDCQQRASLPRSRLTSHLAFVLGSNNNKHRFKLHLWTYDQHWPAMHESQRVRDLLLPYSLYKKDLESNPTWWKVCINTTISNSRINLSLITYLVYGYVHLSAYATWFSNARNNISVYCTPEKLKK